MLGVAPHSAGQKWQSMVEALMGGSAWVCWEGNIPHLTVLEVLADQVLVSEISCLSYWPTCGL